MTTMAAATVTVTAYISWVTLAPDDHQLGGRPAARADDGGAELPEGYRGHARPRWWAGMSQDIKFDNTTK